MHLSYFYQKPHKSFIFDKTVCLIETKFNIRNEKVKKKD